MAHYSQIIARMALFTSLSLITQHTYSLFNDTKMFVRTCVQAEHRVTTAKASLFAGLSIGCIGLALANIFIIKDGLSYEEKNFSCTGIDSPEPAPARILSKKNTVIGICSLISLMSFIGAYSFIRAAKKTIKKNLEPQEFIDSNQLK